MKKTELVIICIVVVSLSSASFFEDQLNMIEQKLYQLAGVYEVFLVENSSVDEFLGSLCKTAFKNEIASLHSFALVTRGRGDVAAWVGSENSFIDSVINFDRISVMDAPPSLFWLMPFSPRTLHTLSNVRLIPIIRQCLQGSEFMKMGSKVAI